MRASSQGGSVVEAYIQPLQRLLPLNPPPLEFVDTPEWPIRRVVIEEVHSLLGHREMDMDGTWVSTGSALRGKLAAAANQIT
jgi:hypothetical protein